MTLRTVGTTYTHSERAALLDAAADLIERLGHDPNLSSSTGITMIGAIGRAAAVYSDPTTAFHDGMFLVNSRFLIETGTPSRMSDVAWVTWTRSLDTVAAAAFLHETAALVLDNEGAQ